MSDDLGKDWCPKCGRQRRMRYPGNDPENGPAQWTCPEDSCQDLQDMEKMLAELRATVHTGRDLAEELGTLALELEVENSPVRAKALREAAQWILEQCNNMGPV